MFKKKLLNFCFLFAIFLPREICAELVMVYDALFSSLEEDHLLIDTVDGRMVINIPDLIDHTLVNKIRYSTELQKVAIPIKSIVEKKGVPKKIKERILFLLKKEKNRR